MNETVIIESRKLSKIYQEGKSCLTVLRDIDFSVRKNELIAILGESGSGKSTFLHILAGLDTQSSGEVFILGADVTRLSEKERCKLRNETLGFVYQFHHLLLEFNVLENVAIPLLIRGTSIRKAKEQALFYIEKIGLADKRYARIGELSGGQRQRVAIARAMVTQPRCILADEPTGNLDKKSGEQALELMLHLNATSQTSFLVVTHNLKLAAAMGQIYVLQNGTLRRSSAQLSEFES